MKNFRDVDYFMRLLVDRVPSMLAYWDRDLRCRFANRAYEVWFGVDPDALLGTSIIDLLGPDLFRMNEPFMRAALAGATQMFERIVPGPDGVQRHSLAQYIPDTVNGEVLGFLVQVTDVTQLKQTQAALQREQLLRGQIEAHAVALEQLLDERTRMLDVLAHEVRQPLNNASAALQAAQAELQGQGGRVAADRVTRAQVVLGEVIAGLDNTLAAACLLARAEPIHREDMSLDTLIRLVVAEMPEASRERIQVQRDTPAQTAAMDMSLVRLALRNLLSNALKFSPAGSPVRVRVSERDDPPAVLIDVSDSGPGIPPALLPRLFERGARGHGEPLGHGIGLYIVRQVMALHGGSAEVLHTGPDGTTLRMSIAQAVPG